MANTNSSLLSLTGQYQVAPEAEWGALLGDASLVLDSVVEQIRNLACDVADGGSEMTTNSMASYLFGTLQLAELAKSISDEGHSRALKEAKERTSEEAGHV